MGQRLVTQVPVTGVQDNRKLFEDFQRDKQENSCFKKEQQVHNKQWTQDHHLGLFTQIGDIRSPSGFI